MYVCFDGFFLASNAVFMAYFVCTFFVVCFLANSAVIILSRAVSYNFCKGDHFTQGAYAGIFMGGLISAGYR